jgi:hypothetical protein
MGIFQRADNQAWDLLTKIGLLAASATGASFVIIFLLWSRFLDFGQNYSLERLILFKKITFQNSII